MCVAAVYAEIPSSLDFTAEFCDTYCIGSWQSSLYSCHCQQLDCLRRAELLCGPL